MDTSDNAWNWQVWKYKERKGGGKDLIKWIGFFFNEKDAFAWIGKRPGFVVNNVGPAALRGSSEKVVIPRKTQRVYIPQAERRSTVPFHGPAPMRKPKRALTAEEKRLQAEAAVVLEQHKADEAVELAAEAKK